MMPWWIKLIVFVICLALAVIISIAVMLLGTLMFKLVENPSAWTVVVFALFYGIIASKLYSKIRRDDGF